MTLLMEATSTTAVVEQSIQRPGHIEASTGWASTAVRAHALLTQTMPEEELDELVEAAVPPSQAIVLPAFFFG